MTKSPPITPTGTVQEPHRGAAILTLGILSLVINGCGIGWILGLIAWIMGAGDIKKMRAGMMDRQGEGNTKAGMICGIISVVMGVLGMLVAIAYVVIVLIFGLAILSGAASGGGVGP